MLVRLAVVVEVVVIFNILAEDIYHFLDIIIHLAIIPPPEPLAVAVIMLKQ